MKNDVTTSRASKECNASDPVMILINSVPVAIVLLFALYWNSLIIGVIIATILWVSAEGIYRRTNRFKRIHR